MNYTIMPKKNEEDEDKRYKQADCFIPVAAKKQALPIAEISEDDDIIRSQDIPSEAKLDEDD